MLVKCLPPKRTVRNKQNVSALVATSSVVQFVACGKLPVAKNIRERHLNGVIIFAPSLGSFGSELIACHIINFGIPY